MISHPAVSPARLAVLALACGLAACSSLDSSSSDDKVNYRSGAVKGKSLEVPPDLTQLSRDSRYQTQGGVISASGASATKATAATGNTASVAVGAMGGVRVERAGQQRWLVLPMTPEQAWPLVRNFWEKRGFAIDFEDAQAGLLETNWAENRAKLPKEGLRRFLGGLVDRLYDTGERDRFRTRIERTAEGSEVFVSHRGVEEFDSGAAGEGTGWRSRPNDPLLEAEMLTRLMVALGVGDGPARAAVAGAPEQPARARAVAGAAALEIDEPFDRAWRRVGLALDRGGFTVEDRDRAAGLYYVRYVDPKSAGKEEPGFWARLMGESNTLVPIRYRVVVKSSNAKTLVTVLTSAGAADVGENGQRIAAQLVNELR